MNFHLRKNLAFSLSETVATLTCQFLLYRLIVHHLSIESLGIWSLVMASISIARLGDLGISAGINRFVAMSHIDENQEQGRRFIETALLTSIAVYVSIGLIAAPVAWLFIGGLIGDAPSGELARRIIPYAAISFAAINVSAVVMSGIAGMQKSYVKSCIVIGSNVLLLALAKLLIDRFGLRGIAAAQTIQSLCVLVFGWLVLCRLAPGLPILPRRWSPEAFRALIRYGAQVQIGAIGAFIFEPATKLILAHFGGIASVGLYEVASRVVMQGRSLVNSLNQTLMSTFAALNQSSHERMLEIYRRSTAVTAASALLMAVCLIALSPIVRAIALPNVAPGAFQFNVFVLAIGWSFNMLAIPVYVLALGTGQVRNNTISHIAVLICAPALAFYMGHAFGPKGVVVGAMLGQGLGTLILLFGYLDAFSPIRVRPASL